MFQVKALMQTLSAVVVTTAVVVVVLTVVWRLLHQACWTGRMYVDVVAVGVSLKLMKWRVMHHDRSANRSLK